MFSKKGKRKIVVDNKVYYWCVTVDKDTDCEPFYLNVFSEDKYLFGAMYHYMESIWNKSPLPIS